MAASLKDVMDFFGKNGGTLKDFRAEWEALTDQDKNDLKEGIGNGSLNY
jgi:hypothetical protein